MKSSRASSLVLAGAVGLAGVGIGVGLSPVSASAATTSTTQAVSGRLTAIKNALTSLVKDGTLTQAQADKVATTLDSTLPQGGPGGPGMRRGPGGPGLDEAATVVGMTTDQLRTQLDAGKTLAQVAKAKGISEATLVDKLVAAAKTHLAADVKAGRLTQAQADAMTANLKERITQRVTHTGPVGGMRHGDGDGDGPGAPPAPSSSGSSTSPTAIPSTSGTA